MGTRSGAPLASSGGVVPLGLVPHGGETASKRARMEPHRPLTIDTREQKVRKRKVEKGPSKASLGSKRAAAGHMVSTEPHVARTVG